MDLGLVFRCAGRIASVCKFPSSAVVKLVPTHSVCDRGIACWYILIKKTKKKTLKIDTKNSLKIDPKFGLSITNPKYSRGPRKIDSSMVTRSQHPKNTGPCYYPSLAPHRTWARAKSPSPCRVRAQHLVGSGLRARLESNILRSS